MSMDDIAIFRGITARMNFINARQAVLSQNIANADTPGYSPRDLKPVNFSEVLEKITTPSKLQPVVTNPGHVGSIHDQLTTREGKQKQTYETAPDGNAVIIEEQLIKANENSMNFAMMTNLYQRHVGMLKTAIGRN